MYSKNNILVAVILLVFSWFTPLFTILSQLMVGFTGSLLSITSSSWFFSNLIDTAILLAAHIIFVWVMLKKFRKKDIVHGSMIFALINGFVGMLVFRNPVSTPGLFYQTVNFLSNVILSNVVFVPEQGKPYMLLLPLVTLAVHLLLPHIILFIQTNEKEAPKRQAENAQ
ncbi:hypothetical protein [Anoxynatronum buryatiense]|uniref:Uncharacterized protein n=1 Tax=Anoxynatronum buryatiense TaxID=489973 RepID=A0AA45WSH6_9CLOT|nr:hypothetical protein [Anoxynatronum buryatiense]SMP38179.1 hypothetical protein SAMN06296020_10159 [Anoxynatronum buryatiense]